MIELFYFILGLILSYLMSLYFHKKAEKKLINQFKSKSIDDQKNRIIHTARELKNLINSYSLGVGSWWHDEAHMRFSWLMDLFINYIKGFGSEPISEPYDDFDEPDDNMDINIPFVDKEDYEHFMEEIAKELYDPYLLEVQERDNYPITRTTFKKIFGRIYLKL